MMADEKSVLSDVWDNVIIFENDGKTRYKNKSADSAGFPEEDNLDEDEG